MIRWGKNPAPPATGAAGAGAAGEVAVEKVPKIEVHSLVSRPSVYGLSRAPRGGGSGGAEGDDINKKAEEFIKQRKLWFHRP
ncbi:hypothetical protein GQ55_3G108000 [Panicum hallii var. hallii]|jgi:hypothetical protein|uniref:Uncharacterized protein n=2 Tax=Panicum hallii TaxID=206008 RepID=A0A2T7E809_9POAL|nr:hypothetical protein PAHAL_3G114000 [Panicum hallii]PUZ63963.1 hypothetical protein GQ55_3G108000 [Panicum hallii var. hallii]